MKNIRFTITNNMSKIKSSQIFTFDGLHVFYKHTDEYGYVHPYNFLEWTSYVRESFFQEIVPSFLEISNQPIKMMTTKITSNLLFDSLFGDSITGFMTFTKVKNFSFNVIIKFFNKRIKKDVCWTEHTLVFLDATTEKFTSIPKELKQAILPYIKNV